jgi:hypothetical protein
MIALAAANPGRSFVREVHAAVSEALGAGVTKVLVCAKGERCAWPSLERRRRS